MWIILNSLNVLVEDLLLYFILTEFQKLEHSRLGQDLKGYLEEKTGDRFLYEQGYLEDSPDIAWLYKSTCELGVKFRDMHIMYRLPRSRAA